jgi:hypothetical protein
LIEAGWNEETIRRASPFQITWMMRRRRRERAMLDQRQLMILTAATAGEGAMTLWRHLEDEIKGKRSGADPEPQMPLSQADFERMMQE